MQAKFTLFTHFFKDRSQFIPVGLDDDTVFPAYDFMKVCSCFSTKF